jgi:hypothetical protein
MAASVPGWSDRQLFQRSIFFFKNIVVIVVAVWPQVILRPDREMRKIFPTTSFWSVAIYTHPSHARWVSWPFQQHTWPLRALSFLTQAFLDPLWVFEILVLDLSVLELCGTSDSSSKHHRLVTLGGCRLLDGLEEWKPRALQEDCEGGLVFLWEVLCSPCRSSEEQL